jgi:hypothetical protein
MWSDRLAYWLKFKGDLARLTDMAGLLVRDVHPASKRDSCGNPAIMNCIGPATLPRCQHMFALVRPRQALQKARLGV